MAEKIKLSPTIELEIGNTIIKVKPLSIKRVIELSPKLQELEKISDLKKQGIALIDFCYEIIKDLNELTKEQLSEILTLEGAVKILQIAFQGQGLNLPINV